MARTKDRFEAERELKTRIKQLIQGPPQAALDGLSAILDSKERWAVREAIRAIASIDQDIAQTVLPKLSLLYERVDKDGKKADPLCEIRKSIVATFGYLGATAYTGLVRRAMKTVQIEPVGFGVEDTALDLRATAAMVLVEVSRDPIECLTDLAILLFDTTPNVPVTDADAGYAKAATRRAAAKAIASLSNPAGAAVLAASLSCADARLEVPDVISACMEAYVFLNPPHAEDVLGEYLLCKDPYLAASAASAIAQAKREGAIDILVGSFDRIVYEAQAAVVYVLSGIRSANTAGALVSLINTRNYQARLAVVEGCILYNTDQTRTALRAVAEGDECDEVRQAALAAINNK